MLFSQKELYIGHFADGLLAGLGSIKFPNGGYYYGEFNAGTCSGYGSIHNGNVVTYRYENDEIDEIGFESFLKSKLEPDKNQPWGI